MALNLLGVIEKTERKLVEVKKNHLLKKAHIYTYANFRTFLDEGYLCYVLCKISYTQIKTH